MLPGDSSEIYPPDAITRSGSGDQREIIFTPAPNKYGHAVMSIAITDGVTQVRLRRTVL